MANRGGGSAVWRVPESDGVDFAPPIGNIQANKIKVTKGYQTEKNDGNKY